MRRLLLGARRPASQLRARRLCSSSATPPVGEPPSPSSAVAEIPSNLASAAKERVVSIWESFAELLIEHPIRTNAVTTGLLCASGDAIAQWTEWKLQITSPQKEEYNWARTGRMAVFGTVIGGPILAMWYRVLNTTAEAALSLERLPCNERLKRQMHQVHAAGFGWGLLRQTCPVSVESKR